uniref:SCARECROW gene regulator-like protein, putative n=3 Tax=Oryza TaxID=4527 RepID=Q2RA88_ORYSJ|nr:SCARECROW gene regulator-like protein, putative [Oryza sativa Japonica Group]ABA91593.1 GRAS family transcription factor containing protein [Oryza sativa Japonica Group]
MVLDSNELHQHDAPDVDVSINCDDRIFGQESVNLAAIQEELLEEDSLSDLLLAGAEAVEAGDSILASVAFSRLDDFLSGIPENGAASSFDRLAYHFDQGLRSRMSSASTGCYQPEPLPSGNMLVHQIIQELSPFVKFAHFTTNQAILDAIIGDMDVHVVDLNIGEGIQWSSLMSDLARCGGKSFRLTAITTYADCHASTHDTVVRLLSEFADSLELPFQYNSICVHNEDELHAFFEDCKGSVIVSCDTTSMYYKSLSTLQSLLLVCVKKLQPKLVVTIEEDLVRIGRGVSPSSASFVEFFFEALHHFTTVFESMASCFIGSSYEPCLRLVEMELLGPRIQDFVVKYGSVRVEANASEVLEGFMACELSACNIAQARMLVGLFNRVFGVVFKKISLLMVYYISLGKNDLREPNKVIWSSLAAGCGSHGIVVLAFYAADKLLEFKPKGIETYIHPAVERAHFHKEDRMWQEYEN